MARIDALFKLLHDAGASDLHLSAGSPPIFRLRGEMERQNFKSLSHELCLQIASMEPKNAEDLLKQPYIRDDKRTVAQIVEEAAHKTGENIVVRRFTRFRLGQE